MARTAADIISWNSVISRLGQKRLKHIKTICYAFVDFTETCFFMYLFVVSYLYIYIYLYIDYVDLSCFQFTGIFDCALHVLCFGKSWTIQLAGCVQSGKGTVQSQWLVGVWGWRIASHHHELEP